MPPAATWPNRWTSPARSTTADGIVYQAFNLGLAEYLGGSPGAAEALFAESLDLARRMGMKRHTGLCADRPGHGRPGGADPGWSARLHGAADQALADLGHALEPLEARLADVDRQRLRAAMGDRGLRDRIRRRPHPRPGSALAGTAGRSGRAGADR